MSSRSINEKLSEVLKLFLLPNYKVVSTTYLDLLLTHLTVNKTEPEQYNALKSYILEALELWSTNPKPCQPVTVFTLKLVGLISRDEDEFDYLENKDVFNKLLEIFKLRQNDVPASLRMAYTTLLIDVITHKLGRKWVMKSGVWIDIVKFAQLNHTLYVTRESHKFIYTILIEESQNKEFCKNVVLAIGGPLTSHTFDAQLQCAFGELYSDQNKLVCSTFDLITSIYEKALFWNMDNTIPDMFEELHDLTSRAKAFFEACISTRLFKHVHTLWVLLCFAKMKKGLVPGREMIDPNGWFEFRNNFCCMQVLLISKKYIIEAIRSNKWSITYWTKLQTLRPFTLPHEHKFDHQNIALLITPMGALMNRVLMKHAFGEMFIDKLSDVTCQPVQRLCYLMKDMMIKEKMDSERICKASIEMLLEIIDVMDRSVAVITFQSMCYVLKNYMPHSKGYCNESDYSTQSERARRYPSKTIFDGDPVVDNPLLLSTLLHGLSVMTEKFQFKWPDCVETICVLTLAQGILNHCGALPNLCVKALNLCKLAISNFMPPNLALLVESDSHMNDIGTTLFKRLHDPNWEVRDSVLEVLTTIAGISENKYPAFQKFLLSHQFLKVALEIAMTDSESYVRSSALVLIATSVKINNLWEGELSRLDLPEKTIKIYRDESEAVVRREAVTLIKELYVFRKWQKNVYDEMIKTMAEAAVVDLHWEVKVNALEYWRHFIQSQLTDQGMLDGSFPSVTFSKEHRKIVSLNEVEIKLRLNKALDNMARENCLGVLLVALRDESDFEVSKSAADIIGQLKSILLKYKIDEPEPDKLLPKDSAIIDNTYVKPPIIPITEEINNSINASGILDEIVDANDANLLASIYQNSMKMEAESENPKKEVIEQIAGITRQQFLSAILSTDIDAYIEERKRWLKNYTISFDSVLEDIITVYHQNGITNSMDCY